MNKEMNQFVGNEFFGESLSGKQLKKVIRKKIMKDFCGQLSHETSRLLQDHFERSDDDSRASSKD